MILNARSSFEALETLGKFRRLAAEIRERFSCRSAQDLIDAAAEMEEEIVGMLAPENMSDVRSLPPELQEAAVSYLIGTLDNSAEVPDDDPTFFCTDWSDWQLRIRGTLLALLSAPSIETPSDIVRWLEERAAQREASYWSTGDSAVRHSLP
jgi:hypothetical protein